MDTPVKKLELFEKTFGGLGEGEPKSSKGLIGFQHHELSIGLGIMPPNKILTFDSKALNGLRGFAAFHIMLLHILLQSNPGFNILGAISLRGRKIFQEPSKSKLNTDS